MALVRQREWIFPERIEDIKDVDTYLHKHYEQHYEESIARLADFESFEIDTLTVSNWTIETSFKPSADATVDLGATSYRFKHLYLSGNITDDTNTLTVANAKGAHDKRVDTWGDGLQYSSQTASVDYNTTNLKITSTELDTIQSIATGASPTFANLNFGATPLIRQASGALTIQTNEGVNTHTHVDVKGKGTGFGWLRIYDPDDAEYLSIFSTAQSGQIRMEGTAPGKLHFQSNIAQDITYWAGILAGNPYFYIYGWHATDIDYMRIRVEADGDALIEAENNLNIIAGGGAISFGNENLSTTGTFGAGNCTVGTLGCGIITTTGTQAIKLVGTGTTGNASLGYIGFFDSNGSTRRGYIGDASSSDDDIYLNAETGKLKLLAAEYINLGTHTYFLDDVVMSFGASLDYSIGFAVATDTLQIVDGATLGSNIRLKLDSSGHFDFGAGNLTTTGILTLPNEGLHLLDIGGDHDLIIKPGTDLGADRILTLTTGDAARTITLSGNPTLDDWFDQSVKQASSPTFVTAKLTELTDGYVPYHVSDAVGLANSPIFIDTAKVFINETVNTKMVKGLTIQQDGEDDEILAFKSSDVAHGVIDWAETDTYNMWLKEHATEGGVRQWMFTAGNVAYKAIPVATTDNTTKGTGGTAPFSVQVYKKSGTDIGDVGADANLVAFQKGDSSRWILDEDGDTWQLGTCEATTLKGNLHWDYITNEPTYYPPEFHYHVGKEIVSTHLVDIDNAEADDIFDVLDTAAIHGQGNYDWFGTWDVTAGADCTATVAVLSGDDKMLTLTDGNAATRVVVELNTAADHPMVSSVIQFDIRQSTNTDESIFYLRNGAGAQSVNFQMADDGNIKYFDGAATTTLCAYAANTWYTIRAHIDCVAGYSIIWVDNIWNCRKALTSLDYINNLYLRTKVGDTGYTLNLNNLKIFNLTV